ERQSALRALLRMDPGEAPAGSAGGASPQATRRAAQQSIKKDIERLRGELRRTTAEHRALEQEADLQFNPHWGPIFREGYEISKFGEQVEAYACVYTSRVSNLRYYSPMQYFRGPRDRMPHERGL